MHRTDTVLTQCCQMVRRWVTFMTVETVSWITFVQVHHQKVTLDFGEYGRRRNRRDTAISTHDRARGNIVLRKMQPIHQYFVWLDG